MKVYSMLSGEILDIINKRLENGQSNQQVAKEKGVRD